jgi:hypothetical protein
MKYNFSESISFPTQSELKAIKDSIRSEFPNGPRIQHTATPNGSYSFNEIAQNIAVQLKGTNIKAR